MHSGRSKTPKLCRVEKNCDLGGSQTGIAFAVVSQLLTLFLARILTLLPRDSNVKIVYYRCFFMRQSFWLSFAQQTVSDWRTPILTNWILRMN